MTALVLWFLLAVTGASALLFSLIPSLQASRSNLESDLHGSGTRATASVGSHRLRRVLVASQFAVTVPLLVGAGLLISSLAGLGRVDPGFDPNNVLTLRGNVYSEQSRRVAFWTDVMSRVAALPGVEAAGVAAGRPPLEHGFGNDFVLEDRPVRPGESHLSFSWMIVSPEYFDALGVPLIRGRMLEGRPLPWSWPHPRRGRSGSLAAQRLREPRGV